VRAFDKILSIGGTPPLLVCADIAAGLLGCEHDPDDENRPPDQIMVRLIEAQKRGTL
jgi:hypothetical protein